ncbi:MAG TPA: hypothetical protein VLD19_06755 [Chitinophagaceae bacterium]|nr:hypothetical protein [Chitinophagaceae bacterium]
MLPRPTIFIKNVTAIIMMAAIFLLVSGNYWAYGFKKEKQSSMTAAAGNNEEESGSAPSVPNPTEEKTSGGLQNISEYLHDHSDIIRHPVAIVSAGYDHRFDQLPVHHPELLTPPPKRG